VEPKRPTLEEAAAFALIAVGNFLNCLTQNLSILSAVLQARGSHETQRQTEATGHSTVNSSQSNQTPVQKKS
jgi:hypothetical protein